MVHKSYSTSKTNRDYLDPTLTEDDTFLNYLALAAAILDPKQRKDMRFFLNGLYNEEEAKARMKQIDYLRELGCGTKMDHEKWLAKFNEDLEKHKRKRDGTPVKVINKYAGTEMNFESIKKACEEYDLNYKSVKQSFNYHKSDKIKYKGLIIKKI